MKWISTAVFYVFQNDGRARGAEPRPQPAITLLASESEEPRLAGGQPRQQTVGERRLSGHRHRTSLNDGQQCAGDIEEDGNVGSGAEREVGTGIGDSPYKQAPVVDVQQVAKYVSSEQHATKLDQSEHGFSNIFDRYAVEKRALQIADSPARVVNGNQIKTTFIPSSHRSASPAAEWPGPDIVGPQGLVLLQLHFLSVGNDQRNSPRRLSHVAKSPPKISLGNLIPTDGRR